MTTREIVAPPRRWQIIRGAAGAYKVVYYSSGTAARNGAKRWANADGELVLVMQWARDNVQDELNQGWALVDTVNPDGAIVEMDLDIENRYEDGTMIPTQCRNVVVVAPPPESDAQAYDEWAYTHIFNRTGTGRTKGNSFYDVTITKCSDPRLVGRTFEWGY